MCQLQQKHFLRQDSNLTHPFHLVSGYHKSRIFVSASHIIQSLLNNSKAISVPKMNKIFFYSFHLRTSRFISFASDFILGFILGFILSFITNLFILCFILCFILYLIRFILTLFIPCWRPAASLGSVPGQTISFHVNIRRHLNAQSRVWLFHFFVFDVIHFQSFSVYDLLPNDRRVWTPMPSAEINHSWRRSLY